MPSPASKLGSSAVALGRLISSSLLCAGEILRTDSGRPSLYREMGTASAAWPRVPCENAIYYLFILAGTNTKRAKTKDIAHGRDRLFHFAQSHILLRYETGLMMSRNESKIMILLCSQKNQQQQQNSNTANFQILLQHKDEILFLSSLNPQHCPSRHVIS